MLQRCARWPIADRSPAAWSTGRLAFDNAVSPAAAAEKGIVSKVAGQADILVVPDLEAGNMLAKQLTFLAGADAAGVVLGARVPIILTSRADAERTRMASCAVAVLIATPRAASPRAECGGLSMADAVLTLNAGSSSIKFSLFEVDEAASAPIDWCREARSKVSARHRISSRNDPAGVILAEQRWPGPDQAFQSLLEAVIGWAEKPSRCGQASSPSDTGWSMAGLIIIGRSA